jgi:hypothetical protein
MTFSDREWAGQDQEGSLNGPRETTIRGLGGLKVRALIPFLAFPPELRKIIYTTNAIESLNYQLRKSSRIAGTSPPTTR